MEPRRLTGFHGFIHSLQRERGSTSLLNGQSGNLVRVAVGFQLRIVGEFAMGGMHAGADQAVHVVARKVFTLRTVGLAFQLYRFFAGVFFVVLAGFLLQEMHPLVQKNRTHKEVVARVEPLIDINAVIGREPAQHLAFTTAAGFFDQVTVRPLDDFRRIGRHLLTGEGDGPGKKYGIQFVHDSLLVPRHINI